MAKQFVEYVVLDIEPVRGAQHGQSGKWLLADVQVARVSDFGVNDNIMSARTHLGHHLQAGDTALGYDLASLQIVDPELEKYRRGMQLPDVLLVKKSYQEKRRRRRAKGVNRVWKLQRLEMVNDDDALGNKAVSREHDRAANDEEAFMQELEEDEELRGNVNFFKDENAPVRNARAGTETDDDDDDVPEVPIESLLDGLSLMRTQGAIGEDDIDDDEEEEEDHEMMD